MEEKEAETPPYAALTPDCVLDAVDATGLRCSGTLLALNSYENRVYQVGIEDAAPVIAKFYRPLRWSDEQILEEHAFLAELTAEEIPVVEALRFDGTTLCRHAGYRFAVFPRQGGRAPELSNRSVREWMGRFLGRIHVVGARAPYRGRPFLDIESFGVEPSQWLLQHDWLPESLREVYRGVVAQALDGVRACVERAGDVTAIRLHGDCHEGNVLWTDAGPHFVDFDDSRGGPAVQDFWMLLAGDTAEMQLQLSDLLAGYEDFADFDRRELALVEALRTLRLVHYSAWIARRWSDPAFPAAFPWFTTPRYWEERILELREQIAAMQEPALIA
jgi:Ser/Thr protein kinase RdoA (MazF antagonist)